MKNTYRILADDIYMSNNTYETGLNNNDLIVGPSGAGKTRNYVKPNIMQCNDSLIIADTKGNLHAQLSPLLIEKGYNVLLIDYKNLANSCGYNPFDFIRYDSVRKKYCEQDIYTMATTIVPVLSDRDPFWETAAKMYLTCLIAYTLECLPPDEHTLESVHKLLSILTNKTFDSLIFKLETDNPKSFAVRQYKSLRVNKDAEKMSTSIIAILFERINDLVLDDCIDMYTSEKKINFHELSTKKTALFLTVSDTDRSMDRLSSLFYQQSLQSLCNIADNNPNNRLDIPVRFIFDDFATNTVLPDFDNIISVIRSRDIYVSIILQSITQLDSLYGESRAMTIINNCDNYLYLGGQDMKTAEHVAIKMNLPVTEVLNMPLQQAYLFTRGSLPRSVKKFDITKHKHYSLLPEAIGEYQPPAIDSPHFESNISLAS